MKLRTDDDIHQARLVYLGPPGYTLPIQLTYAQYGLGAAIFAVLEVIGWIVVGNPWEPIGVALGLALPATSLVRRFVNPDRPARKVLATAARDWRQTTDRGEQPLPRMSAANIRIGGRR